MDMNECYKVYNSWPLKQVTKIAPSQFIKVTSDGSPLKRRTTDFWYNAVQYTTVMHKARPRQSAGQT